MAADTEALRPDGVEMYGLYVEAVEVAKHNDSPRRYWRMFLVANELYVYARGASKKATTWRRLVFPTHADAAMKMKNTLAGNHSVQFYLRGEPVLTQLRAGDVLAIDREQVPPARYTGQQRIESAIGKFDIEAWKDEVTS